MKLTTEELQQKIDNGDKFIVDLYADWCGPCRMIGPVVEKVSKQLQEEGSEVSVYKFDIEQDKEMACFRNDFDHHQHAILSKFIHPLLVRFLYEGNGVLRRANIGFRERCAVGLRR